jgi:uncharacterized protein YhfF
MGESRTPRVRRYWREFCARHGVEPEQRYDVYRFGNTAEMADRLLALVLNGPKRATAGLADDFDPDTDPLPEVGVYSVILDGHNEPGCVVRTTEVEIKPLRDADAAFAWDEGEGDRTLDDWLAGHRAYFARDRSQRGLQFTDDMLTVFERFELVWPAPSGS